MSAATKRMPETVSDDSPTRDEDAAIGAAPSDWRVAPLGAVAVVRAGGTPQRSSPEYWDGDIPWVTTAEVNGSTTTEAYEYITRLGLERSAARLEEPGTVLVALYGQGPTRGRVAHLGIRAATNQACAAIVPSAGVLPRFLFHLLGGSYERLRRLSNKGSQDNLSGALLRQFRIALPPPPEQRAIAEALSDVDGLLGALEALIAKKRAIKQAAMQQLLTGKTRLPGFSGPWETKRLGEIATIRIGRTPSRSNSALWGRGHAWLSIADLNSKVVCDSKEQITDLAAEFMTSVPKGTLLMSFKLSIGRLCFAGCDLFTNEAICSIAEAKADPDYLYYALSRTDFSLYGKQAVKGYTLNSESLRLVELQMPEQSEQTAIATTLADMDAEVAALERRREKTRAVKQGMMKQLLTGRVRMVEPEEAA